MLKKFNFLFGAMTVLAVGTFSGCSTDDLSVKEPEKVDHDQVRYLSVAISNPLTGTRAANFEEATDDENFVKDMYFVFYDSQGLPTGEKHYISFTANTAENNFTDYEGDVNVGRIWTSVIPVKLQQGENLPSYVMCFINPVTPADIAKTSLSELQTVTRKRVVLDNGNFPMSNSVYYGSDPVSGESYARITATPITTAQLYTSEDDAKNGTQTIDIYVERYAAKIKLDLTPDAISTNTEAVNGYDLDFVPAFWRPNGIDEDIYAVKRYGVMTDDDTPDYLPSYGDLTANFVKNATNGTWWNEPANHRSYWGCSPSYFENDFPMVSDDITDVVSDNTHVDYPYKRHYFNYSQIVNSTTGGNDVKLENSIQWNPTNGFNTAMYVRETTSSYLSWQNPDKYNALAAIPGIVIVGHYKLTPKGGTELADNTTFYLYGKTEGKWNLYTEAGIKDAMIQQQNVVMSRKSEDGNYIYAPVRTDIANFKVEHPDAGVRTEAKVTVAGRLVALQMDKDNIPTGLFYFNPATSEYETIAAGNIDRVNADLLSAGYARKYYQGLAYFNIPVEHLGIANINGGKQTNGLYNFETLPAGSFGIVRNHSYNIVVSSVSGLGTALRDENQPIVPPLDEAEYYISARLNILNWRIVPEQSVTL